MFDIPTATDKPTIPTSQQTVSHSYKDPFINDDDSVKEPVSQGTIDFEFNGIDRAQLIRLTKTATGNVLYRLDFARHSDLREKVASISLNEELDNLFTRYGEN